MCVNDDVEEAEESEELEEKTDPESEPLLPEEADSWENPPSIGE